MIALRPITVFHVDTKAGTEDKTAGSIAGAVDRQAVARTQSLVESRTIDR